MNTTDFQKRYDDCFELYRKYKGKKITLIEREMRSLGHAKFSRRILYSRVERGLHKPGWIDRYGWRQLAATGAQASSLHCVREDADPVDAASGLCRQDACAPGLVRSLDGYGREIFVENENETGKPQIWYRRDKHGKIHRSEQKSYTIFNSVVEEMGSGMRSGI